MFYVAPQMSTIDSLIPCMLYCTLTLINDGDLTPELFTNPIEKQ